MRGRTRTIAAHCKTKVTNQRGGITREGFKQSSERKAKAEKSGSDRSCTHMVRPAVRACPSANLARKGAHGKCRAFCPSSASLVLLGSSRDTTLRPHFYSSFLPSSSFPPPFYPHRRHRSSSYTKSHLPRRALVSRSHGQRHITSPDLGPRRLRHATTRHDVFSSQSDWNNSLHQIIHPHGYYPVTRVPAHHCAHCLFQSRR